MLNTKHVSKTIDNIHSNIINQKQHYLHNFCASIHKVKFIKARQGAARIDVVSNNAQRNVGDINGVDDTYPTARRQEDHGVMRQVCEGKVLIFP